MSVLPSSDPIASGPLRRRRLGLRRRVGLITAVVVAGVVVVMSLTAFLFVRSQTQERFDQDLLVRARTISTMNVEELNRIPAAAFGNDTVAIVAPQGVVASTPQSPPIGSAELAVVNGRSGESVRGAFQNGKRVEVVAVRNQFGTTLVLASSTASVQHTLRTLAVIFALLGLAGVIVAAIVGFSTARAGLRPVQELTDAAQYIARTEDLTPIPVDGDDELARLAEAFNTMLVALDSSRTQQRQFVADAGHELKTPLTSLQTNLDLLVQVAASPDRKLDPAEQVAMLSDARAQVTELSVLVTDLVDLARDDTRSQHSDDRLTEQVDLAHIVGLSVDRVRHRAPTITFDVQADSWEVNGDPAALERSVTNLLDNAAKFSPDRATVQVRLQEGTLTVTDHGPGIPEHDLPHIFDRFYRSIDARAVPGSGLGLAIVAQAVERHGGTVGAASAPSGGSIFTIHLPGTPTPTPG